MSQFIPRPTDTSRKRPGQTGLAGSAGKWWEIQSHRVGFAGAIVWAMNRGRPPTAETQAARGQGSLFDGYETEAPRYQQVRGAIHTHGEYVAAIGRTVAAAEAEGEMGPVDAAGVALLVAGARSLEALEALGKPYGSAKLIPAMAEVLREYHLTPESRPQAGPGDKIDALLAELAANDDSAAPVRD